MQGYIGYSPEVFEVFWHSRLTLNDSIGRTMRKRIDWQKIVNIAWDHFDTILPKEEGRGRATNALAKIYSVPPERVRHLKNGREPNENEQERILRLWELLFT